MSEEKNETIQEQDAQQLPEAKFLSSIVTSVRLMDDTMRHVQFSIFEDVESHQIRVFYDVVDPRDVHPKL